MNQRIIQDDDISRMITDMRNARFNDNNPLIQSIKNHVDFESSVAREIPQVQNKIDILTQDDANTPKPSMSKLLATSQHNIAQSNNCNNSNNNNNNNYYPDITEDKVNNQECYIPIAKICILTVIIVGIICWFAYMYIPKPYNYIVICTIFAAGFASDYFYCNKYIIV